MKILVPLFILVCALSASAANFVVTRTDDRDATCISGSDCSLREAVRAANNQTGADSISFSGSLGGIVTLTTGELIISDNLPISGNAARQTIRRGGELPFRIFNIAAGVGVVFNNLNVSGGLVTVSDFNGTGFGGGIYNLGNLQLFNSAVQNNGLAEAVECCGVNVKGGGIYNAGSLNLQNSEISGNSLRGAQASGGGVFNDLNAQLSISDSIVADNKASANATGQQNSGCGCGGGIFNSGTVTINKTIVRNNSATGRSGNGGGLYSLTNLTITNSAIVNNKTQGFQEISFGAGVFANGIFTLSNSTVSGNAPDTDFAPTSQFMSGGGLAVSGNARIANSTVAFNTAGWQTGGIYGNPTLYNTIVANNTAPTNPDIQGYISSNGFNLIGDASGSAGWLGSDLLNRNPNLAPLADNGGATLTHALMPSSPAINAGNNANAPATDQRGLARIVGGTIDIGAFESATSCFYTVSANPELIPVNGGSGTINLTAVAGCTWTATSNASWITVSPASGSGSATITYTVAPNSGAARSGQITVGGQTITVNQAGCTYSLSPANAPAVSTNGGVFIYNVITQAGCQWTSASNSPWLSVVNGASGTGPGFVTYAVAVNNGARRSGVIVTGGQNFNVTQLGNCEYRLDPQNLDISGRGGNNSFTITTDSAGCNWTAVSNVPWITISNGSGSGSGIVYFSVAPNFGAQRSGTITAGGQLFFVNQSIVPAAFDFDGDGTSDLSIYRDGFWWFASSANGNRHTAIQWGLPTDKLVPADYDGDFKTDAAVFRDGTWHVLKSSDNSYVSLQFGFATDIPVPGDYDGDGRADFAVFRPADGYWYIFTASGNFSSQQWGEATDKPVVADFDGDGKIDLSVFRPGDGTWYILQSRDGFRAAQWGESTDVPVVGDYDGDFKSDLAVFRPATGTWYIIGSRDGFRGLQFGLATDKLVPADYDGDGKTDPAVVRDGMWYLHKSTGDSVMQQFGFPTDKPVPSSYIPN